MSTDNRTMTISYSEKHIKFTMVYGILMILIGLLAIYEDGSSIYSYLWLVLGLLQTGTTLYQKKYQYLTIDNTRITRHSLKSKSIQISDIKKVRRFRNSYKIETLESTLNINKNLIETESLYKLDDFFKELKLSA